MVSGGAPEDMLAAYDRQRAIIEQQSVVIEDQHSEIDRMKSKVDVLANIAERAENGGLKTNATWWEIHGGTLGAVLEWLREHWLVSAISVVGTVAAAVYKVLPWFASVGGT